MMQHRGKRLTIRYCEVPPPGVELAGWVPPSWSTAMQNFPANKRDGVVAKMVARRNRLADGEQLRSPDDWNTEAKLPDGKRFYAIKADKLRAYGWFSSRHKGVFYISHFAYKRGQKLVAEDANQVIANWRLIEETKP